MELGNNLHIRKSLRGIKRGRISENHEPTNRKCIIICDSLPSMILSGGFLQSFNPVLVVGNDAILDVLQLVCSTTTVVCHRSELHNGLVETMARTAEVCFADCCVNSTICEWLLGVGVNLFVTMKCPRRIHESWTRNMFDLIHSELGGVTDCRTRCYIYTQRPLVPPSLDHFSHQRDAHTILDDSVWCKIKRRKPTVTNLNPLRVINVGSPHSPLYHINGLLPLNDLVTCNIITPSIGMSASTWGIRGLTRNEIVEALDMSCDLVPGRLPTSSFCHDRVIPATLWYVGGCLGCGVTPSTVYPTQGHSSPKRLKLHPFKPAPLGASHESLFSHLQLVKIAQSAVKSDDAVVNTRLWLQHFIDEGGSLSQGRFLSAIPSRLALLEHPMDVIRQGCLAWWKRRLVREYRLYLLDTFSEWQQYYSQISFSAMIQGKGGVYSWTDIGLSKYRESWRKRILLSHSEWMKGCDALVRALRSSWWDWDDGSAPFYWRWPKWYQKFIRDGIAFPFKRSPPKYMVPQRATNDPTRNKLIIDKLTKVLDRRYMGVGTVRSLTAFFDVPKGTNDIRMVYDGTINGFNDSIEVPRFGLPTIKSHLRAMDPKYHMVDADVGECFLNFYLHPSLQPYVGVDLTKFLPLSTSRYHWVRWNRAGMGLKSSPYQACQAMMVVEEMIRGNRHDPHNPFRWDSVIENLPGSENYDPTKPWIYKVRLSDGHIACDIFIYVDDLRITGWSRGEAWKACCRATSILGFLGVQDAPRKRRDSSNMAGAWAGSVVYATEEEVLVLVTEEKWTKAKSQVQELGAIVQQRLGNRKRLQEIRGFLNYVATTYPILSSYLMGLHLTIDGWRKKRCKDGWRKSLQDLADGDDDDLEVDHLFILEDGPKDVEIKPRLKADVEALTMLITGDKPPLRRIRANKVTEVLYGFGDASGSAFGTTLGIDGDVYYEYGQWCSEDSEESSNWRELKNLVDALEGWIQSHELRRSQLFLFTDNSTAESAYWKGTSRSKKLCNLVLRMKCIALWGDLDLHVIHVSGKRMKDQGTDGLSRGDQNKGVMKGIPMKLFVPLHLRPTEREPGLVRWINRVVAGWNFKWLKTEEWFEEHHDDGNFIWDVAPSAGDLAYEMLDKMRLKRPTTMHMLLIPRLFTGLWRRLLTRRSDCYIKIDWKDVWDTDTHHEPLLLFICVPYNVDRNFENRRNSLLEKFEGILQKCRMSQSTGLQQGDLLREFLQHARKIPTV